MKNINKRKSFYSGWLLAAVIFATAPYPCIAQNCPDLEIFIKKTSPALKTWKDIYNQYKSYPGCDDGAYAEAYSEFIVHTLAMQWDRLAELIALTSTDFNFHGFILKHIDATTDKDDINTILNNSRKRCPSGNEQFCKEIETAAFTAIEEINKSGITMPSTQTRK